MKNRITLMLLFSSLLLAIFLRFYKLGQVPNGLYRDETAIGYNSYSILTTGKDEYGQRAPLYFKSFGDYKLPVYVYVTAATVKFFGLTPLAVRLPSAIFGVLTVLALYFLVKELTEDRLLSAVSSLLLAATPWHIHYSRAAFEVSLSLFFFTAGGTLLIQALTKNHRWKFLLGTLCFILSLYTYNLTRLLTPVLYLLFLVVYRKELKTLTTSEKLATIGLSAILLAPFVATFTGSGGVASAQGTLITSSAAVQAQLLELRSYMIALPPVLASLFFNRFILTFWQYLQHLASYLSVTFLFLTGSPHGNHGIGNVGQFYLFELPLIVLGIVASLKQKGVSQLLLFWWFFAAVAIAALTREAPHATRGFFLLVPVTVWAARGLMITIQWLRTKTKRIQTILVSLMVLFALYNILFYLFSYFVRFPVFYAKAWRSADAQLVELLKQNGHNFDKIIIDKQAGFVYTSLLFYAQYPASDFQQTVKRAADDSEGFSEVISFGKYEFRDIDWPKDFAQPNTLLITTRERKPLEIPALATFYYPQRPVVFAVKQEIVRYPTEETSYVAVASRP